MTKQNDILEQNVSTLLESGGEAPKISDAARARIREALVDKHGAAVAAPRTRVRARMPLLAVGVGLAATAAAALVVTHVVGSHGAHVADGTKLDDGSTFVTAPGGKVIPLGPRHVRVEGEALLDVVSGKGRFVVETAEGHIEVLGTRFYVHAEPAKTTTAVVRGQVKLATSAGSVVVHAGEQAIAEHGRAPVRGPAPRLSHLVSWAQQARHREETGVQPLRNGSLFAREPNVRPNGQFGSEYPLPLAQLTVDVVVEDRVARVALDQTFHNPHDRVLEGVYKFAIPPDAALQRLAMYVDGKLTESAVVERMRARRIYEELVYRRVDPALLEYAGTGRLNLRVYPIPAQQDKRMMIAYTQSIPKLYSDWTLSVPLPEVDQPVADYVVTARIKGCANCELSAPGEKIDVERSGNDAVVKVHRAGASIGDSFVVHVREGAQAATVAVKTDGSDHYMMVRAPADLGGSTREHRARSWVILDDVSASRAPFELSAQADVVDSLLRELDEEDKVSLIAFDVQARQLLAPTRVDDVDRMAVRRALREEGGVGATDFAAALEAATKALAGTAPDDAMIVYIGDGVITSGPRNLDALRAQLAGKARFIGVGIGDGPDTQTLDALAGATGGFSTTIDLSDDVRWRTFDLVAALSTTRVTGVTARLVDAAGALVPSTTYLRSAQLADGEEIELVAKLAGDGTPAAAEIAGTRDGKAWTQRVSIGQVANSDAGYLPRMWAQHHIAARLLAKHEPVVVPPCVVPVVTHGEQSQPVCPTEGEVRAQRDEEIRKEVVTLGKQYFLLSRHTSLLVLENDAMYATYGVRKGGGDTWAPYALPAKIPVTSAAVPADVVDDAELVREPLQIFYSNNNDYYGDLSGETANPVVAVSGLRSIGAGRFGGATRGYAGGSGGGGGAYAVHTRSADEHQQEERTRGNLGLSTEPTVPESGSFAVAGTDREVLKKAFKPGPVMSKSAAVRVSDPWGDSEGGFLGSVEVGRASLRRHERYKTTGYGVAQLVPAHFTYPADPAFDDLSALVPALVPDAADDWRVELAAGAPKSGSFPIDPVAKQRLDAARAALPSGVYHWGDLDVAIDAKHRLGWRRTTDTGLAETASYDGAAWVRRYAELGITATRAMSDDDIALALAHIPVWIAEPSHYARWFVVTARGSHEVVLSRRNASKDELAYVLRFDDHDHLVSITDEDGAELISVTWGGAGPSAATVGGDALHVGFTPDTIADASRWAHGASQEGVLVELPARLPAFWKAKLGGAPSGSAPWRHVERQLLVAAAALGDRAQQAHLYDELRESGGVELGDLVLAGGGLMSGAVSESDFAAAIAPLANVPLAQYLAASRDYAKKQAPAVLDPKTYDGLVGAMWALRSSSAYLAAGVGKRAVDDLLSLGDRAFVIRLVGAAISGSNYRMLPAETLRVWDSVAKGPFVNVARAQAAQTLYQHGTYDAAAQQIMKMVDTLDLSALPPRSDIAAYVFQYSRRGPAGGNMMYAAWRDRVLAGKSYEHTMAFLAQSLVKPADAPALLAHAQSLAGGDVDKLMAIAGSAQRWSQPQLARSIVDSLLKSSPTRELLQMAAGMARSRAELPEALAYLEKAQTVGADEEVDLDTVRRELREIIGLCRDLAMQSTGAERATLVKRALEWGRRWRLIDLENQEIDLTLGNLLVDTGDVAGGWRQLSSAIERDPWSSYGYTSVADTFEREGKVAEAVDLWQQAIVIDQTNPTPRLRKAQALIALGKDAEGDALLKQIADQTWHPMWSSITYQAKSLLDRGKSEGTQP